MSSIDSDEAVGETAAKGRMGAAPRRRRCTAFRFLIVCPDCGCQQWGWFKPGREWATLELSHDASFAAAAEAAPGYETHCGLDRTQHSQRLAPLEKPASAQVDLFHSPLSKE